MSVQVRRMPRVTREILGMARDELPLEDPGFYARTRERIALAHGAGLIDAMADIIERGDVSSATLSWYNKVAMTAYGDPTCTIDEILQDNAGLFNLINEKIRSFFKKPHWQGFWERSMLILYACIEAEQAATKALESLDDLRKKVQ